MIRFVTAGTPSGTGIHPSYLHVTKPARLLALPLLPNSLHLEQQVLMLRRYGHKSQPRFRVRDSTLSIGVHQHLFLVWSLSFLCRNGK